MINVVVKSPNGETALNKRVLSWTLHTPDRLTHIARLDYESVETFKGQAWIPSNFMVVVEEK